MKNKDVVFIIAVKKDGQLKPEYEIGIESWRRWCKKNDVELFLLEEPVLPMEDMHILDRTREISFPRLVSLFMSTHVQSLLWRTPISGHDPCM